MLDIVRASFNLDIPAPPEDDLIAYAKRIFDKMDVATEEILPFEDYSLYLSVEEGSIKGLGKVMVYASALYTGIAMYGSFVQGVEIIKRQGKAVAQAVIDAASSDEMVKHAPKGNTRVSAGVVSHLEQLFVKVRNREIAPEEATRRALLVLNPTGAELSPEASLGIASAVESLRLNLEQLHLDLGADEDSVPPSDPTPRRQRPMPAEQHLVVVIERKERHGQPRFKKKYK
jgi:hypothetical protein